MKTINRTRIAHFRRPGAINPARNPNLILCLLAARSLAAAAIFAQCLGSTQAADALAAKEPATRPAQVQKPTYTPQGRQMARYKAFARQAKLPAITVATNGVLEVGDAARVDITRLGSFSTQQKEALADQFGVPVGVIDKVVQRVAGAPQPDAEHLAQGLRTAVIDYRFLKQEWDGYHPPAEGKPTKAAALAALQTGDISKAWELYDTLRKPEPPAIGAPAPPANLRVVAEP